ncbi:hypothetical protein MKW92_026025 [Papaver armeniacum]|nr:hypothetical protein MKW92_026025 [Papaver armeniacum]
MSCFPNLIVMAPSDEDELVNLGATAVQIDDRPVCFRYLRGGIIGKGKILAEGKDIAFLVSSLHLSKRCRCKVLQTP